MPTLFRSVSWGIFCASSWTWCIGMFLPAILLRDYGWPGFLVFAIPNVAGCAAFGYLIGSAERSRRFVAARPALMRWFSIVTVAYHFFFLCWVAPRLFPTWSPELQTGAVAVTLMIALVAARVRWAWWPLIGVGAWIASFVLVDLQYRGGVNLVKEFPAKQLSEIVWLTPIMAFGFLLCPLADLTFHRALQETNRRETFLVFASAFSVMILLTCAYAPEALFEVGPLIAAHLLLQSAFTVAVHVRAWFEAKPPGGEQGAAGVAALAAAGAGLLASRELIDGESMYLRFLVFYGLLAPLLLIFPVRRRVPGESAAQRWRRLAPALMVFPGIPLFEIGFVDRRLWIPAVGVGAMLLVWMLARYAERREPLRSV